MYYPLTGKREKEMNRTGAAWAVFFTGYIILLAADLAIGVSYEVFQGTVYALIVPAVYLLYKGSRGKGGTGLRVLLTVTQFWIGYALAAFIWLVLSWARG